MFPSITRIQDLLLLKPQIVRFILLGLGVWFLARVGQFHYTTIGGFELTQSYWDVMAISGFASALMGLMIATYIETLFERFTRIGLQEGLIDHKSFNALVESVETSRRIWVPWSTGGTAFFIFLGIQLSMGFSAPIEFLTASTLVGAIIGNRLGTIGAHGAVARHFQNNPDAFRLIPGHPDKAGGTAKIGGFILFCGALTGIIILFSMFWIYNASTFSVETCYYGNSGRRCFNPLNYDRFIYYYWAFIIVASIYFYKGTVEPIVNLRPSMIACKEKLGAAMQAQNRGAVTSSLNALYEHKNPKAFKDRAASVITALEEQHLVTDLPTFPLSKRATRWFGAIRLVPAISILLSFIPGGGQAIGQISSLLNIFSF